MTYPTHPNEKGVISVMGYGGGGGFFPFGIIFIVLYAVVVIYFLMQLTGISKALQRIASALEKKIQ
jgi:uncharacterized membrane protein